MKAEAISMLTWTPTQPKGSEKWKGEGKMEFKTQNYHLTVQYVPKKVVMKLLSKLKAS